MRRRRPPAGFRPPILLFMIGLLLLNPPASAAQKGVDQKSAAQKTAVQTPAAAPPTAHPDPLRLEAQPAALTLESGGDQPARLFILAHNPAGLTVTQADLDIITPPHFTVEATRDQPLPWSGDLSWTVRLTGEPATASAVTLGVRLRYLTAGSGQPPPVLAATSVSVAVAAPVTIAAALKTALLPAEGVIDEFHPLAMHLQIDNTSQRSVEVKAFTLLAPHDIILAPVASDQILPAGQSLDVPLNLTVQSAMPDSYAVVIGYQARLVAPFGPWQPASVQSKVTIGVPGVTEALQFVGIPSLLLAPGALAVLTFTCLLPILIGSPGSLEWKSPGALIIAIILSIVAAFLYPLATRRWSTAERDYLKGYDLQDVIYAWGGAIALAASAAVAIAGLIWARRLVLSLLSSRMQPAIGDMPLDILRKLQRHGADFRLHPVVRRTPAGAAPPADPVEPMLILPFGAVATGERWLVPRGKFCATNAPGAPDRLSKINAALDRVYKGDVKARTTLLRECEAGANSKPSEITFGWIEGELDGPRKVTDAEYVSSGDPRTFLEYRP